jgi:hypothetical protein
LYRIIVGGVLCGRRRGKDFSPKFCSRGEHDHPELEKPSKSRRGVTPSPNEWQLDHKTSKSKGGDNSSANIQIWHHVANEMNAADGLKFCAGGRSDCIFSFFVAVLAGQFFGNELL